MIKDHMYYYRLNPLSHQFSGTPGPNTAGALCGHTWRRKKEGTKEREEERKGEPKKERKKGDEEGEGKLFSTAETVACFRQSGSFRWFSTARNSPYRISFKEVFRGET